MTLFPLLFITALVQDTVPGTYDFVACREQCSTTDTAAVVASGIIVLAADHSGCFNIAVRRGHHSYLALHRHGYTVWRQSSGSDSLVFQTYRSPDAWHRVQAVMTDSGFVGIGHSSGAGAAYIDVPDEFIVGRRTGAADLDKCSIHRMDRRSKWAGPFFMIMATLGVGLAIVGSK